jgi:hypothetical protein
MASKQSLIENYQVQSRLDDSLRENTFKALLREGALSIFFNSAVISRRGIHHPENNNNVPPDTL